MNRLLFPVTIKEQYEFAYRIWRVQANQIISTHEYSYYPPEITGFLSSLLVVMPYSIKFAAADSLSAIRLNPDGLHGWVNVDRFISWNTRKFDIATIKKVK